MSAEKTIVWGRDNDTVHVGRQDAVEELASAHEFWNSLFHFNNWAEAREALGPTMTETHLSEYLDTAWFDYCSANDLDESPRPLEWIPEGDLDPFDFDLTDQRIDNPYQLRLPSEFFAIGTQKSDILLGEIWTCTEEDLESLAYIAQSLGFEFVQRDDLIQRCCSDFDEG